MTARADQLQAIERWFMARGTPHLMEDYSATGDVFTRMIPVLTGLAVLEALGALDADFSWWQNVLAGIGGLALLVGLWAGINTLRRRPALTRPARVGPAEITTFVVAPALITYLISQELDQAITLAVVNIVLLGAIYVVTSYGLLPLTRWALAKTTRELGAVAGLLGRALPLLLLIQIVLFINTEMWQVADGFDGRFLAAVVVLFVLIGITFLLTRLPRELGRLATFASVDDLEEQVAGTPAEGLVPLAEVVGDPVDLSTRQRGNVLLVALFSQGLQVLLVTLLLAAFYVAFGLLTITPDDPGDVARPRRRDRRPLRVPRARPPADGRAAQDQRLPGRVLRPVLHGGARHRRHLPRGVLRRDPRRAPPDVRGASRVPRAPASDPCHRRHLSGRT